MNTLSILFYSSILFEQCYFTKSESDIRSIKNVKYLVNLRQISEVEAIQNTAINKCQKKQSIMGTALLIQKRSIRCARLRAMGNFQLQPPCISDGNCRLIIKKCNSYIQNCCRAESAPKLRPWGAFSKDLLRDS